MVGQQSGSTPDITGLSFLNPDQDMTDPRNRMLQAIMMARMNSGGGMVSPVAPAAPQSDPVHIPLDMDAVQRPSQQPASSMLERVTPDQLSDSKIRPAGFDDEGMPTEFPATSRMNAAREKLRLAEHPPHALRNNLIMGGFGILGTLLAARGKNTYAGAGAAQGFERGMDTMYQRGQTNINRANEQYQFEAGQEERQREAAIRERLAMSQLEAQKAYRDLMIEMRGRGQDVTMRGQDISAGKAGFNVAPGPTATGAPTLTPKSVEELPEVRQAQIAMETERQNFMKQQELGGGLNLQHQRNFDRQMELRKQGIDAMIELRKAGLDQGWARLEEPTQQVRSMAETAATVLPHIEELRQLISDADKERLLGPLRGRVSKFLSGEIGTTGDKKIDKLLGRLNSANGLMSSALLRTHFGTRGGQGLYDKFIKMLDTGKATPDMLNGALDEFKSYATGYAQAGGVDLANFNAGGSASYNPASVNVNRAQPSPTPKGKAREKLAKPGMPPPGAKIIEYDQLH